MTDGNADLTGSEAEGPSRRTDAQLGPGKNSFLVPEPTEKDKGPAALSAETPEPSALGELSGGWRPIETAPRDGTLFLGCNLDHPSFGSWPMYRRVRHSFNDDGEIATEDLRGWVTIGDVCPDLHEGHDVGPEAACAIAPDDLNKSVRYGWMPLPEPSLPPPPGDGKAKIPNPSEPSGRGEL